MRSLEPAAPGLVRKPLPPFLSKLLAKEEQDKIDQNRIASFDFLPLFEMLHKEYKIEFDLDLAKYYKCLILIKGCEIYDQDCFDANLPPIDTIRYSDISAMETQIMNQISLNMMLQERLNESEKEILSLNKQHMKVKAEL